jgi:hypothetical protein
MLKNDANIDEFSIQFDNFNLKKEYEIKGLDPNQIFMKHMAFVGYSVSFSNTFLFEEEEDDSQNPQALLIEKKQEYIDIVISTIDQHRQHGRLLNERSTRSPNTSNKIGLPKQKSQSEAQEQRKYSMGNSDDGGDENTPKGSLERPHKLSVTSERKRQTHREGGNEGAPEDEIVLEDMELDVNIEDIECPDEEQRIQERREVATSLDTQEPIIFEEESLTLHSAMFDKYSKKLIIENVHSKNEKVQGKLSSKLNLMEFQHLK